MSAAKVSGTACSGPEFSRPVEASTIGAEPRAITVTATDEERRRLAGRFRLAAIGRLEAELRLVRRGEAIHADGTASGEAVQHCVVTGDPVPVALDVPIAVRFVADAPAAGPEEEIELSAEDLDTLPVEDGRIDLGELVAESFALALDPYPRAPNADAALAAATPNGSTGGGAFAALAALRGRMPPAD
ncbi:DUF177 domain-containing protein [Sphingomonas changnyeongensis]|uniref:DUF177 domain-containing protein n=1 Tax=Sphingomonas changnyeongensis TaxID=2698679 RepID=A0A7Z2NU06_9SPHN|nr:DUF177 domain-containing protein [Sphingomonas changnyeongensis]QHL89828.1 DUF177 domain-containing protein [Sphingomonas changnyeongensis]